MGPKKSPASGEKRTTRSSTASVARATRSQVSDKKLKLTPPLGSEPSPKKKKARTPTPKKKQEVKPEEDVPAPPAVPEQAEEKPAGDGAPEEAQEEGGTDEAAKPEDDAGKGKAVAEDDSDGEGNDDGGEAEKDGTGEEAPEQDNDGGAAGKTVIIEHCKEGKTFKAAADQVKDGLEISVPGITVLLNPYKPPRKGCFEVREEGGEVFVSLVGLKRPFKPLKDLDLDQVVADIVSKLN